MVKFTLVPLDNVEALMLSTEVDTRQENQELPSESNRAPSIDNI